MRFLSLFGAPPQRRPPMLAAPWRWLGAAALAAAAGAASAAVDLAALWDFNRPDLSEQRLSEALAAASGDDALILKTQIARTHGLRKDFAAARAVLESIAQAVGAAGSEARARYELELGRTHASAAHPRGSVSEEAKQAARASFERALAIAQAAQLDGLAIDAIHMLAFVDTAPADQLKWGRAALAVVEASSQPQARQWEASVRNNIGHALHALGRFDEALAEFERAVALRERGSNARATRIAHWSVAWTLRALGRIDEALAIQQRLERESAAAGAPDRYVYEELEWLHRARGDAARADHYGSLARAASGVP